MRHHTASGTSNAPGLLRPDALAVGVLIVFAAAVLQRLLGFARSVLFCRLLEPAELGEWDMALGFLMLAAPVAVLSLPGCFGRYVEHYRQRGQLRMFLRRTLSVIAVLSVLVCGAVIAGRAELSQVIFARADRGGLVLGCALALVALIGHNVATEIFSALRMQRVAAGLGLLQVAAFVALGAVLLAGWEASASSAVLAYAVASLLTVLAACYLWRAVPKAENSGHRVPASAFWSKVLSFTVWIWATNALANLFGLADRYLLLHHAQLSAEQALAAVGQYHSARIVPMLLISAAAMLANVAMPYFSSDWESGRRQMVADRIKLLAKVTGLGLTWCGLMTLVAAPWLFGTAFAGKFTGGQEVLPWTLMCGAWGGMIAIVQLYLLCNETPRAISISFAVGLVVSIICGLLLLPRFGLLGAALASCAAHLVGLLTVTWLARSRGLRIDFGMLVVAAAPLALGLGLWPALIVVSALTLVTLACGWLVTGDERRQLSVARDVQLARWKSRREPASLAQTAMD